MNLKTKIVDCHNPLGEILVYEASSGRWDQQSKYLPKGINSGLLHKIFKDDFELNEIIEIIEDCKIHYIQQVDQKSGRILDEIYYFEKNSKLFHGKKVWSQYHPFVDMLSNLQCYDHISSPAFFVGSRRNFTHQVVDFYPNFLLRNLYQNKIPSEAINLIGMNNEILSECIASSYSMQSPEKMSLNKNLLSLNDSKKSFTFISDSWRVKSFIVEALYLVKHISIFRAIELLRSEFTKNKQINEQYSNQINQKPSSCLLVRSDNRILHQNELIKQLERRFNINTLANLQNLTFDERISVLQKFNTLILPPGSENINGFCFAPSNCSFIQMLPKKFDEQLHDPFLSYAGIRYNLPRIKNTIFWSADRQASLLSGEWSVSTLNTLIQATHHNAI